jgi:hypothetical protein
MSTNPNELPELSYAGVQSFMKSDVVAPDDLAPGVDVGAVGVPYDGAVSRQPGARHGPAAMRSESGWYAYLAGEKGGLYNVDTERVVDYGGVTIRDSPAWTLHLLGCTDVTVTGIDLPTVHSPDLCRAEVALDGPVDRFSDGDRVVIGPTPAAELRLYGTIADISPGTITVDVDWMRAN